MDEIPRCVTHELDPDYTLTRFAQRASVFWVITGRDGGQIWWSHWFHLCAWDDYVEVLGDRGEWVLPMNWRVVPFS
jgi:hypothetical protein